MPPKRRTAAKKEPKATKAKAGPAKKGSIAKNTKKPAKKATKAAAKSRKTPAKKTPSKAAKTVTEPAKEPSTEEKPADTFDGTELNPRPVKLDFNGPIGAGILTVSLPLIVFGLYLLCNEDYVVSGVKIVPGEVGVVLQKIFVQYFKYYFLNANSWAVYLIWFVALAGLSLVVKGHDVEGTTLRDGTRLGYTINGKELSLTLVALVLAQIIYTGTFQLFELVYLYDKFLPLMIVSWEFALILATVCYAFSFVPLRGTNGLGTKERILAIGGNSGNRLFDWFMGRELNPRIGRWDVKLFCELRPGMLLWCLIDLACVQHQYVQLGRVTNSLILVTLLQLLYIFDGVLNEEGCLTMIDITTDGFGFMLAFGDLCWVPFTYSLQARYLSFEEQDLAIWQVIAILAVNVTGFYIFKSSNNQKSDFKQGKLPELKSIQTPTGSKLLVDGWWAIAQHINYLGDILIALSWCLPTGFSTPLTYFYVIYFTSLLINRQQRDEDKCRKKYGDTWDEYEKQVPWKIVPHVY